MKTYQMISRAFWWESGNDSTLEAMLINIRKYLPSAIVTCVCTGPQVIAKRFGIGTLPIDVNEDRNVRWTNRKTPSKIMRGATRIRDEIDFWMKRTQWMRSIDQFIVVGTGALDDMAVINPWNAPYDLYKWCRAARLAGTKVSFVSVGAGPIKNRISRTLMLSALRLANYRSYRDEISMMYLESVGFETKGDKVFPDLVFSLPNKVASQPHKNPGENLTIGLGVIGYYGWRA